MKKNIKEKIWSIIISSIIITIFSRSTTWLYSHNDYGDSAIFEIIGKYWGQGKLPYITLWDQKGPLIFFVEMLGAMMPDNWGLYLLQIISLSISIFFLFKFLKELESLWAKLYAFIMFIAVYTCVNAEGNLIEEYMLPLLMLCIYNIYRWANHAENDNRVHHNCFNAFLYGCVLGCSLMTRLTNALGICGAVIVIAFVLLKNKEWKNLVQNIIAYILGFSVVVVPFILYFYINNCLEEMWFATFTYNLQYAGASSLELNSLLDIINFLCTYGICFALLLTGVIKIVNEKKLSILSSTYIGLSLLLSLWYLKCNGYAHYAMLCLPYLLPICIEWTTLLSQNRFYKIIRRLVCAGYFIIILGLSAGKLAKHTFLKDNGCDDEVEQLTEIVKEHKQSKIILYNLSPIVYLKADVMPCYKYFANQDFQASKSPIFGAMVKEEFGKCYAEYIISKSYNSCISDILKNNYTVKKDYGNYILYKRNW